MPKISVIMPVYNVKEEWLRESIESVLAQTYTDFEFLIIDDGSTNNTAQILQEYAKNDERVKIVDGEHKGIANALNKGLEITKGEYIARMDGDDISMQNRFEKQITYMEKNRDIGILGTAIELFPNEEILEYKTHVCLLDILQGVPIAHPTVMMRVADLKKYKLSYNEKFKTSEDYDLWSRAVRNVKICNLPDVLLKYRRNPNGNSRNVLTTFYDTQIKQELMTLLTDNVKLQNDIYKILDEYKENRNNIFEKIFSIKNAWKRGERYKMLYVLGLNIKLYKM